MVQVGRGGISRDARLLFPLRMDEFRFEVWPTEFRVFTQQFGENPDYYSQFGLPGHDGVDIRAPVGSRIFCVAPGRVVTAEDDPTSGNFGRYVRVLHQDGYQTTYAHLSALSVAVSDEVEAGDVLGLAGDSGNARGAHLHLGLQQRGAESDWPYNLIDPTPYLLPLIGWQMPVGPALEGWILTGSIYQDRKLAQVHRDGARFWTGRNKNYWLAGGSLIELLDVERSGYSLVRVTYAALGIEQAQLPIKPNTIPQPTVATVDGWAWVKNLALSEKDPGYAVVNWRGINLRRQPFVMSANIGLIRPKSTVLLLPGKERGYQRVRVLRSDFEGDVALPVLPPLPHTVDQLPTAPTPDDDLFLGWIRSEHLELRGAYARISYRYGAGLYPKPLHRGTRYAIVKGFATVALAGADEGVFTPVLVQAEDMLQLQAKLPPIQMPNPLPAALDPKWPKPPHDSTPAWVMSGELAGSQIGRYGTLLLVRPQRDADVLARALPYAPIVKLGDPQGEFTPVRVPDTHLTWLHPVLSPPDGALDNNWNPDDGEWAESSQPAPKPNQQPPEQSKPQSKPKPWPVDLPIMGSARIGLHASADPHITKREIAEYARLNPGVIKVSSFHNPDAVRALAQQHPKASWLVRAFLEFGGRNVSPAQFVEWTLSDVQRTLNQLRGRPVVVELHNEPNLYAEGLGQSWRDGAAFANWWLDVLGRYRRVLPTTKFMYPGLSPGSDVVGVRQDHIAFMVQSKQAIEAADTFGVHVYWGDNYPMTRALGVLDDYLVRVPNKAIWITEASNNSAYVPFPQKAVQYIQFWQALQKRSRVGGVTYFVASSSNPKFAPEAWVGNGIAAIVGNR